jgi:hypothetical protein
VLRLEHGEPRRAIAGASAASARAIRARGRRDADDRHTDERECELGAAREPTNRRRDHGLLYVPSDKHTSIALQKS